MKLIFFSKNSYNKGEITSKENEIDFFFLKILKKNEIDFFF